MALISRVEAAALLDVKVPSLDRALRAGRIFYADPAAKQFDRAALLACWAENRQRRRKPVPDAVAAPPAGKESEAELRRRLLAAQVQTAERHARAEDGERIALAALERALRSWFQLGIVLVSGTGSRFEGAVRNHIPDSARPAVRRELVGIESRLLNAMFGELVKALAAVAPEWAATFARQFTSEKGAAPYEAENATPAARAADQ